MNGDVQQFTEAEQWTLQGAARILKIRLEDLLTAADRSQSSSSGSSISTSRQASSTPSRDDQSDYIPSSLDSEPVEDPWTSTMNHYGHNGSPKTQPTADTTIPWSEPHGALESISNNVGLSSAHEWHGTLPEFQLPHLETNSAFEDNPPWAAFNDPIINVPIEQDLLNSMNLVMPPSSILGQDVLGSSTPVPIFDQEQQENQLPLTLDFLSEPLVPKESPDVPMDPVESFSSELPEISRQSLAQKKMAGKKGRRTGPFADQSKRDEAALTRLHKACISCRMQKISCKRDQSNPDPGGVCQTCIDAALKRVRWVPCLRMNLSNAELLDHGVCPRPSWTRRWKKMEIVNIRDWKSAELRTIKITQDVKGRSYQVKVRQFEPKEGDALERKWKINGVEQSFRCAPYAIADMEEAGRTLLDFADRTLDDAISFYVSSSDPLLRSTYEMARYHAKNAEREEERLLLSSVLRLWCASRMESRSDRICGEETLGMTPKDYGGNCPNNGIILTPPVFSAQLEVIVVSTILQPAKKLVLKQLFKLMTKKPKQSWLCIYLCLFILLHNSALATASAHRRAKKQGLKSRYFDTPVVKSLHHGARVLLAYFHFYNGGSQPFTLNWLSTDQVARTDFNTEQAAFMCRTIEEINQRTLLFKKIKEDEEFENEYFFLSQLFEPNWMPQDTI